jgi:tetratricopeptide (TPR) repeat protein
MPARIFKLLASFFLISCFPATGFAQAFSHGKIIDTVKCDANPRFRYSLYIPSYYNEKTKTWPVIFAFDPGARSRTVVQRFSAAAEKYGYIIACSSNSRNGLPWNEILDAANNMIVDVKKKFAINPARIYTAGFSGGSRVACGLALMNMGISGVIACGAGFPGMPAGTQIPSFDIIELVGRDDMNYYEMCDLESDLERMGKNVELRVFEGGHRWPDEDVIGDAVEWLDLQAIKRGLMSNAQFVNNQYVTERKNAVASLRKGNLVDAARQYKYILKNFPENSKSNGIAKTLDSLKASKDYSKALKAWSNNRRKEVEIRNYLSSLIASRLENDASSDSTFTRISDQVKSLNRMGKSSDAETRSISVRTLNYLSLSCYENGVNLYKIKRYNEASKCFETGLLAEPGNITMLVYRARACALDNKASVSLACLRKAVELGFRDKQLLEIDEAFAGLRGDERFVKLVREMR